MDKADRCRIYAALFGWCMAAWFWISKPLHSIAILDRREIPLPFVMPCGGFFVCLKSKGEIISRTEVAEHRIFFSAGKDRYGRSRLHRKNALWRRVHRDSEHRIVSATIPIHAACGHGRTQGTPLNTPLKRKIYDWRNNDWVKKNQKRTCGISPFLSDWPRKKVKN